MKSKFNNVKRKLKRQSLDDYLDNIYYNNQELIDSKAQSFIDEINTNNYRSEPMTEKDWFKNHVKNYINFDNLSPKQAVDALGRSMMFSSAKENMQNNLMSGLKNFNLFKQFRELTKDSKGRYTKIDMSKMVWNKDDGVYIYDNNIMIDFRNSPLRIIMTDLRTGIQYISCSEDI